MCGITGFFAKDSGISSDTLEAMATALALRGPDDEGFFGLSCTGAATDWKSPGERAGEYRVGLGSRRLAILDLSANGAQPMATPDRRFRLSFNGQIYNYLELKEEMAGITFRSTGDTEVLLHLFARHGLDCLKRLNGVFAFAVYDTEKDELFLARDPIGVKPLYYFEDERGFFFASEIRALLKAKAAAPKLHERVLWRHFMNGGLSDEETLFDRVKKLPPGFCMKLTRAGRSMMQYWDFTYAPDERLSEREWLDSLDERLERAIRRQLRSDVPVGFFLSGGVDSSLLTAKSVSATAQRPTTFTVGFQWASNPEANLDLLCARKLKEQIDIDYREILLAPSVVSLLPQVISALEEPIADPAALCSYLICEAAARECTVLISGQGGDELFGGYPIYAAGYLASRLQRFPGPFKQLLRKYSHRLPYAIDGHRIQTLHRLKKLFLALENPWPDAFLRLRSPLGNVPEESILVADLQRSQLDPFSRYREHSCRATDWDMMEQMMYLDLKTYLVSPNLLYSDKTSMRHSVELRVPLLDLEIVALAEKIPSSMKVTLRESKILLKRLAEKYLPRNLIYRKKTGFGLPLRDWFLKDLQPLTQELLSESRLKSQGLLNPGIAQRWLSEHREMKADHGMKLYSLLSFQLWLDEFKITP